MVLLSKKMVFNISLFKMMSDKKQDTSVLLILQYKDSK